MLVTNLPQLYSKPAATATFITSTSSTADLTTYTFASINLGSVGQYSHIFVGASARVATTQISTMTVAGLPASKRVALLNVNNSVEIWSLPYTYGGSQSIVVTWGDSQNRAAIAVWGVKNLYSETPVSIATSIADPSSAPITAPGNGFVLAFATAAAATAATAVNLTENADFAVEVASTFWAGSQNFTGGQANLSVGCDFITATEATMVAGGWR